MASVALKTYCFSIYAHGASNQEFVYEHRMGYCRVHNEAFAYKRALAIAGVKFPTVNGWFRKDIRVVEIPDTFWSDTTYVDE